MRVQAGAVVLVGDLKVWRIGKAAKLGFWFSRKLVSVARISLSNFNDINGNQLVKMCN
jgi:hypothetical protein